MAQAQIEQYLADKDQSAVPVFMAFRQAALAVGTGVEEKVSRTMVAWKSKRTFATAYVKGRYLECSIDLLRRVEHQHLKASFHTTKKVITHRFTLEPDEEVDADMQTWLREGFNDVGPGTRPSLRSQPTRLTAGRNSNMAPKFEGGKNIAMKVPPHQYDQTVSFYRDVLGLEEISGPSGDAVGFKFGDNNLWIDKVTAMSQAELWLEIVTDDTAEAAKILKDAGIARCDEIENLGEDFDGYWVASPASIIHLINAKAGSWE